MPSTLSKLHDTVALLSRGAVDIDGGYGDVGRTPLKAASTMGYLRAVRVLCRWRTMIPGRQQGSGQGRCGYRSESLLPIGVRDHSRTHQLASTNGWSCWSMQAQTWTAACTPTRHSCTFRQDTLHKKVLSWTSTQHQKVRLGPAFGFL